MKPPPRRRHRRDRPCARVFVFASRFRWAPRRTARRGARPRDARRGAPRRLQRTRERGRKSAFGAALERRREDGGAPSNESEEKAARQQRRRARRRSPTRASLGSKTAAASEAAARVGRLEGTGSGRARGTTSRSARERDRVEPRRRMRRRALHADRGEGGGDERASPFCSALSRAREGKARAGRAGLEGAASTALWARRERRGCGGCRREWRAPVDCEGSSTNCSRRQRSLHGPGRARPREGSAGEGGVRVPVNSRTALRDRLLLGWNRERFGEGGARCASEGTALALGGRQPRARVLRRGRASSEPPAAAPSGVAAASDRRVPQATAAVCGGQARLCCLSRPSRHGGAPRTLSATPAAAAPPAGSPAAKRGLRASQPLPPAPMVVDGACDARRRRPSLSPGRAG